MSYWREIIDLEDFGVDLPADGFRYGISRNGAIIGRFKDIKDAEDIAWAMSFGNLLKDGLNEDLLECLFDYFRRLKGIA